MSMDIRRMDGRYIASRTARIIQLADAAENLVNAGAYERAQEVLNDIAQTAMEAE